jgi:hypothetical protein
VNPVDEVRRAPQCERIDEESRKKSHGDVPIQVVEQYALPASRMPADSHTLRRT